jgi:hypothetical protein
MDDTAPIITTSQKLDFRNSITYCAWNIRKSFLLFMKLKATLTSTD